MQENILEYMKRYGSRSFSEEPFTEGDDLALVLVSYLDFSGLAGIRPVPLGELYEAYSKRRHVFTALSIDARPVLKAMAGSERYRGVLVSDYSEEGGAPRDGESAGDTQFAALCFHLPTGERYACFRGTDSSLAGWREDFSFAFMDETGGQRAAAEYLRHLMLRYPGPFMTGGHSKGGNLAVYAAASLPEPLRARISAVWSNDGPGFRESVLKQPGFQDIKGRVRLFIPESSFVGLIMAGDWPRTVIKSSGMLMFQHIPDKWHVGRDGRFVRAEGLSFFSRWCGDALERWLAAMDDEERRLFVEAVFSALESSGLRDLNEFSDDLAGRAGAVIRSVQRMERSRRLHILRMISRLGKASAEAVIDRVLELLPGDDN
ncbi:MAG: DUF2974 domain-containing protein [Firmicutes bacterium]|nr:DUF2974 domain-containing protein [Bacillota bacterium]